jgi:hypothetical protein
VLLKFRFEFFGGIFPVGRFGWCGWENVIEPFVAFAMQMRYGYQVVERRNFRQIDIVVAAFSIEM